MYSGRPLFRGVLICFLTSKSHARPCHDLFLKTFSHYGSPVLEKDLCDLIRSVDPEGGHQFIPCPVSMPDGRPVSEQSYFHFVCGRRLGAGGEVTLGFDVLRSDCLPDMRRRTLVNQETALALAGTLFEAAQAKGLTGLKEFRDFDGRIAPGQTEIPEIPSHISGSRPG
jgi:hypothetical protein